MTWKSERKIAFFVEGQTEQIFINRLLFEMFGKSITIVQKEVRGGTNSPKHRFVRSVFSSHRPLYKALVVDCGSDNKVKSEMIDNMETLIENGYEFIVGLRDLYPIPMNEYKKLNMGLHFLPPELKSKSSHFKMIIAVHEIEAWFLGEFNHYKKVNPNLTGSFIKSRLGFNPYKENMETRIHPAKDLDDIYELVGKSYTKHYNQTKKIVEKLDYYHIRYQMAERMDSLGKLIHLLETFKNSIQD